MKKLLLLAFVLTSIITHAQENSEKLTIDKGTWNVSGDISLHFSNTESNNNNVEQDEFGFSFAPKIGYAINDNLILGLGIGYGHYKQDTTSNTNQQTTVNTNSYHVFPYVRKFFPVGEKMAFLVQGEARFSKQKSDYDETFMNTSSDSESVFAGIRPGFTYFISDKIALETTIGALGYNYSEGEQSDGYYSKRNGFRFDFNTSNIIFGVSIYL
ncbi:outer membrane beta-barrel protein [Corallibacter sp.]|uniref:outer membrane beta-barrel protein n=1 Tax=Corallibacter sp. TaxID=2038084 RepID=UPI003AB8A737